MKTLLYVSLAGLVIGIAAAIWLAWLSQGSKTIAIATATLFATAILFVVQLRFELRSSEQTEFAPVEYLVHRAKPEIRSSFALHAAGIQRLSYEVSGSAWLVANRPDAFEDRERLSMDFALAEILYFFAEDQPDWQLQTTQYAGKISGTLITKQRMSQPSECTKVVSSDIGSLLRSVGNRLAEFPMAVIGGNICLPPHSTLQVRDKVVEIGNPFGHLRFEVMPSGGVSFVKPGADSIGTPVLTDGKPQFETRVLLIKMTNAKGALYSQHRDADSYAAWRNGVLTGLTKWFE
jgi:hypothetical protein